MSAQLRVRSLVAREILDSRGRPTLGVDLTLEDGRTVWAAVPSDASTGAGEAVERRDGDPGRLGANAIVGASMAARAFAALADVPLYVSLAREPALDGVSPRLPVPHFNVRNGGAHAQNSLDFQEFMLAPLGAGTFGEAVRAGAEIYQALHDLLADKGFATGLGDEGGLASEIGNPGDVCALPVSAIEAADDVPGPQGAAIALDSAANGFHQGGAYSVNGDRLTSAQLIDRYEKLAVDFPIYLIEDGLAEDGRASWQRLTSRPGAQLRLVGDDIFVTETLQALQMCRHVGYGAMISHRSGETPDFIADLAVASGCGCGCGWIKSGAPAPWERVAKYNRMLHISATAPLIPYGLAWL